jgi:hypothetical protein
MIRTITIAFFLCICFTNFSQNISKNRNIFIITTDGFRWQEVFKGADSAVINNTKYVKDTSLIKNKFWDDDVDKRKEKLLPFFWNMIAKKGQLFGNRNYNNEVNVANMYKFSYPGYNEIFTGYADKRFIPNTPVNNKNTNILEYLGKQETYKGKVVAFSSWNVFPFILNEQRGEFSVNSGYEMLDEKNDSTNILINKVQQSVVDKGHTRYDMLTYASAKEYIEQNHPKVVALGFGETDEFAHQKKYDMYLQKAHQFDEMVAELWYYVQTDPFYKDNTTFIITTDHGRGKKDNTWNAHGFWIKGSGQAWLAILGPDILPMGEMKNEQKIYQEQIAKTIAMLLGEDFSPNHPVGKALNIAMEKPTEMLAVSNIDR